MSEAPRRAPALAAPLTAAAAVAVVLAASWPLLLAPNQRVLGHTQGDQPTITWGLWRVATGQLGPVHEDVRFPFGGVLVIADLPEALALVPVTLLAGPNAAFNLLQVLHPALAAAAAAALARDRGAGGWGAAMAGLAYGLCPVLLVSTSTGNPETTPLYLIPLAALAAARLDRGLAAGLGAGAILGLAAWCNPYVAVMAGLAALAAVPWAAGRGLLRGLGAALLAAVALGGAAVAALAASLAEQGSMIDKDLAPAGFAGSGWVRGLLWPETHASATGGAQHAVYLGLTVLLAGLVGARLRRAEARRWLPLALVGVALCLGPALHLVPPADPHGPGLAPLPMAALSRLPGLDQMRLVFRFAALASLGLGLLAAHAVDRLPLALRPLVALLVLADLLLHAPGRTWLASHPALEARSCPLLAPLPPGPVVDVPGTYDGRYLYAQICHGRPVAQGVLQPWANEVRTALQAPPPVAMERLRDLGFRYAALHLDVRGERDQALPGLLAVARERDAVVGTDPAVVIIDLERAAARPPRP